MKRAVILLSSALLPVLWFSFNAGELVSAEYGLIRSALCAVFALLVLIRPKPGPRDGDAVSGAFSAAAGAAGAVCAILGLVFRFHFLEWGGILLVTYGCLRWSLPGRYARDSAIAMAILYFILPLPGQVVEHLQRAMQGASVKVAEILLFSFNVRVWTDGLVLRDGLQVFMVPEACSGMATAVTIVVCASAGAVLMRLGRLRGVVLVALGVAQAVLLNGARIALLVALAEPGDDEWSARFMHDSVGMVLAAGVILVQLEAMWWKNRLQRSYAHAPDDSGTMVEEEAPPMLRIMPRFWQQLMRSPSRAVAVALLAALAVFIAFRNRPYHRSQMVGDVALELVGVDNEAAERACQAALRAKPDDAALKTELARVFILRGKSREALAALESIPEKVRDAHHFVLKAWALQQMGRLDEAAGIIAALPEDNRDTPGVAMVEAELAVFRGDMDTAAVKILRAAEAGPLVHRVRALYPQLLRAEKWTAIAETDANIPYRTIEPALAAAYAHLRLNDIPGLARVLLRAMKRFPSDPGLLRYLYFMSSIRPGSRWEDLFGGIFANNAARLAPDDLAVYAEMAFRIRRPDLVWIAYERLVTIDPRHPYALYLPAAYGRNWLVFRKRFLGMGTGLAQESMRLTPKLYSHLARSGSPWRKKWSQIPLVGEMNDRQKLPAFRTECLKGAIEEFEIRLRDGKLSPDVRYGYASALDLANRPDDAKREMEKLAVERPAEKARAIVHTAEIYMRRGDFEQLYETARIGMREPKPSLRTLLMFSEACYRLKLGLLAVESARRASDMYPESVRVADVRLRSVYAFLGPEDALFEASKGAGKLSGGWVLKDSLLKTGRFIEAENLDLVALHALPEDSARRQAALVEAEAALGWFRFNLPTEAEFRENAEMQKKGAESSRSPFLKQLSALWLRCYESKCAGDSADPAKWKSCGRDRLEQATALHQLALLLAREGRFKDAEGAVELAVELAPESPLLWRCLVGLSDAKSQVADRAMEKGAFDSEIWLAYLTAGIGKDRGEAWAAADIAKNADRLPAGTLARAAEFLLRKGMTKAAAAAAAAAEKRARGFVPAYMIAARCAELKGDGKWELRAIAKAVEYSVEPGTYICGRLVELKGEMGIPDTDVLHALERLNAMHPEDPLWMELLGYARFMRGGVEMSMAIDRIGKVIGSGSTNKMMFLVSAESHRRLGDNAKAVSTLRKARELMPADVDVMNNLVYTLADNPDSVAKALEQLPVLMKMAGTNNLHALDTAAFVYIKAGKLDLAEQMTGMIRGLADETNPAWNRAGLRLAEVEFLHGNIDKARAIIRKIISGSGRNLADEELQDLGRLMRAIEEKSEE